MRTRWVLLIASMMLGATACAMDAASGQEEIDAQVLGEAACKGTPRILGKHWGTVGETATPSGELFAIYLAPPDEKHPVDGGCAWSGEFRAYQARADGSSRTRYGRYTRRPTKRLILDFLNGEHRSYTIAYDESYDEELLTLSRGGQSFVFFSDL